MQGSKPGERRGGRQRGTPNKRTLALDAARAQAAVKIEAANALDGGDRVLAKSVAERLIHALRMQAKRGKIAIAGKERGAIVWR